VDAKNLSPSRIGLIVFTTAHSGERRHGTILRITRKEDDDFTQPGILIRKVFGDGQRSAFVDTVAGSLLGGVREPLLGRAFEYWRVSMLKSGAGSKTRCAPARRRNRPKAWASVERCSRKLATNRRMMD
jgi:hypothetical protein